MYGCSFNLSYYRLINEALKWFTRLQNLYDYYIYIITNTLVFNDLTLFIPFILLYSLMPYSDLFNLSGNSIFHPTRKSDSIELQPRELQFLLDSKEPPKESRFFKMMKDLG